MQREKKDKAVKPGLSLASAQSSYITTVLFVFERPSKNSWIYNSNVLSQTDEPRLGTQAGPKQLLSVCPLRRPLIPPPQLLSSLQKKRRAVHYSRWKLPLMNVCYSVNTMILFAQQNYWVNKRVRQSLQLVIVLSGVHFRLIAAISFQCSGPRCVRLAGV